MYENRIALISALKNEYGLNSLDMFSLKGIKKYNNMIFRFNSNKLQCYFTIGDVWKNANDILADEIMSAMVHEKVSVYKSENGEDVPVVPKGTITSTAEFHDTGVNTVVEYTAADTTAVETVVADYKHLSSIKPALHNALSPKTVGQPKKDSTAELIASVVDKEAKELTAIRQQAEAFNAKLNGLNVIASQKEESDDEDPVSFSA